MEAGHRYRLKSTLGTGGFGSVYKAYDTKLNREVALKRLNRGKCQSSLREQLMNEARVLATLQHPNIVSIYDVSSRKDFDEIVMELLVGVPLHVLVKRHLLQPNDFRHIAAQILHGLSAAHKEGVLHCDIKPENVMLCLTPDDQYELKIFDFGMSESMTKTDRNEEIKLIGSVYVMAPELFDLQPPTEKSDIYALGCLFYFLLTGAYPFTGATTMQVMASHVRGQHRPLAEIRKDLSKELSDWVESFIKTDPAARVASCAEALDTLLKFEISNEPGVFTLPTDLQLESSSSKVVRTLTRRSLALATDQDSQRVTRFLTNTITHSLGITKSAKQVLEETQAIEDAFSPRSKPLPEKAEWYFTKGDEAKGPVTRDQLYRLVEQDKIEPSSMVWHPHYGEWVHAVSCAELKPFFEGIGPEKEEVAKPKLRASAETQSSWFGTELLVALTGAVGIGAWIYLSPENRDWALCSYGLILFLAGFVFLKVIEFKEHKGWFAGCLVLPVVGDMAFALVHRKVRVLICCALLLIGAVLFLLLAQSLFMLADSSYSLPSLGF